jgi:hypothetical protein
MNEWYTDNTERHERSESDTSDTMDSRFLLHYLQSLFELGEWTPERKREMDEIVGEVRVTRFRKAIGRYVRYLSSRPYEK